MPRWFYSSSLKISDGSLTAILTVITIVLVNNTQKCFLHAPVGDRQASVKLFRGADNFLGHYKTSKKKKKQRREGNVIRYSFRDELNTPK